MAEDDTIEEGVLEQLVQKLTPCIERGELDACVEEAARLADELGIDAPALLGLAAQMGNAGKHDFAYVLAFGAVDGLDGSEKAMAYFNAGVAAQSFGNVKRAEECYKKAIEADPKLATTHYVYANLLKEQGRNEEADKHYKIAIEGDPKLADAHNAKQFMQKLTPCIERGDLDVCVEEAARLAGEMGIDAPALLDLTAQMGDEGKYELAYVLAFSAVDRLADPEKAMAYYNAAVAIQFLGNAIKAESNYLKAIETDHELAVAHSNYASLLNELNRTEEAETQYLEAIEADSKLAVAHSNYALLLQELNRTDESEVYHLRATKADPNDAVAHYNYAILLNELNRTEEAEIQYLEATKIDSKLAMAHSNYALLLQELNRMDESEVYHIKAIKAIKDIANPNYSIVHYNFALLLKKLNRKKEAEINYIEAINANPSYAAAHNNYALLLQELNRRDDAKIHHLKAIKAEPKSAEVHGAYGIFLIDCDRRDEALSEAEYASKYFKETRRITQSYLTKAWFYQKYSEKYFNQKEYLKSSDDADRASIEYFEAAKTVEGGLIEILTLQGNVLKAKSFMRKIPPKPWYNKIYKKRGIKLDISELVYNLQNAAIWYQKASLCPVDGKKDICTACYLSISTFSEVLSVMNAFINGNNAEINKDKWLKSLEGARKTYVDKELEDGTVFVDSLKQLVKCTDKLAKQNVTGLKIHEEKLGTCFDNLIKINGNLDGVLGIISDHTTEVISVYAKKEGLGFIEKDETDNKLFHRMTKKINEFIFLVVVGVTILVLSDYILPPYLDSLFNY